MVVTDEMVEKAMAILFPLNAAFNKGSHESLKAKTRNALDAAIALMRGQSEMSKKVEPAPNWCPTCGRRPNDPHAAFCSNPFHLMPKDTADEQ